MQFWKIITATAPFIFARVNATEMKVKDEGIAEVSRTRDVLK
jgi:hypothetical protein